MNIFIPRPFSQSFIDIWWSKLGKRLFWTRVAELPRPLLSFLPLFSRYAPKVSYPVDVHIIAPGFINYLQNTNNGFVAITTSWKAYNIRTMNVFSLLLLVLEAICILPRNSILPKIFYFAKNILFHNYKIK